MNLKALILMLSPENKVPGGIPEYVIVLANDKNCSNFRAAL